MQGNKGYLEAEHVSVLAANQDLQVDITQCQCATHTYILPVEHPTELLARCLCFLQRCATLLHIKINMAMHHEVMREARIEMS